MVGHGSSDNAASYGVYAFGLLAGWTAFGTRSRCRLLGAELDVSGSTVVALSQSGRTPDVVQYVERARRRGAFTVAVTNDVDPRSRDAAEAVLPLARGRGARDRGDEDVHEPGRGARAARGARGGARRASRGRSAGRRAARRA